MNIEYSFWTTVSDKSPMKVLFELVRKSEGILQRIEETQNGFVLATSVPGQPNSGAIYIYDKPCGALFMLVVDGRDDDFSRREIGCLVPAVAAHLNAPDRPRSAHHRPRRRNRKVRAGAASTAATRPAAATVAR
jgi:hypothetical protein